MSIDKLKGTLGEGARANKYKITISQLGGEEITTLGKATSMPGKTIGVAEVFSQGRRLPLAGDTTYEDWSCTFYLSKGHDLRQKIIDMMREVDDFEANTSSKPNISDYGIEAQVQQLDRQGSPTATVTLKNVWISNVGEVQYGADSNDQVLEFECTFTYSHWVKG